MISRIKVNTSPPRRPLLGVRGFFARSRHGCQEMVTSTIATIYEWPRWLRLKDAAKYSALGPDRLKKLAKSGDIVGFPDPEDGRGAAKGDGVWIFDRQSIDDYRLGQAGDGPVRLAVLAGRKRLGI